MTRQIVYTAPSKPTKEDIEWLARFILKKMQKPSLGGGAA